MVKAIICLNIRKLPHPGYLFRSLGFRGKAERNKEAQSTLEIENQQRKIAEEGVALKKNIVSSSGYK
jgi:transcriptional regulator of NAD metabolism